MKIDWKKQKKLSLKALVLLIGLVILPEILGNLSALVVPDVKYAAEALIRLYRKLLVLTYLLFYFLPDKIKTAPALLRLFYFIIFYSLVILFYILLF